MHQNDIKIQKNINFKKIKIIFLNVFLKYF